MNLPTYKTDVTLYSFQVDPFYYARLIYYLQIIQEVAGLHAYKLDASIPQLRQKGMTWVLIRTKLNIAKYIVWPETISVETWPQKPWKFYFPRVTVGTDTQGSEVFRAISQWMVIDLHTHRPSRNPMLYERFDGRKAPFELDCDLGRQKQFDDTLDQLPKYHPTILYSDADFNGHINNISYVSWMLDALPNDFRDHYKVTEIDISYTSETQREDQITVHSALVSSDGLHAEEPELMHKIEKLNKEGEIQTVSLARTVWRKRDSVHQ